MSEEDGGDQDKQYDPSQKKLDDARKKGDIARSVDLTTAATYGGFLLVSILAGPAALLGMAGDLTGLLGQADRISTEVFAGSSSPFSLALGAEIGWSLLPFAALPGLFATLAIIAQRGFVFAPDKLALKSSRLSPIKGFANKFGRNGLFEFAKSSVKLIIYSTVLGVFLVVQFPRIVGTLQMTPGLATQELLQLCLVLFFIVLVVAAVIGAVDFLWQLAEHSRKLRMSRKDLQDEQKDAEGDPMMKQQRRQMAISIAMNHMLSDVPKADVLIVNPEHYAVALTWERGKGRAPVCVAKGVDAIAARMRQIATEHAVPIHADPPTARALYATVEIGEEIASDHYAAVAAAIRFAESVREKARGR